MNIVTEEQSKEMQDRIVEKAVELFARRSVDEVTVMDICRAVGITKPTFYKYISSKEALLLYYYENSLLELEEAWDSLADCEDSVSQILNAVRATVRTEEKNGPDLLAKYLIYSFRTSATISWDNTVAWEKMVKAIARAQKEERIANQGDPEIVTRGIQNILLSVRCSWAVSRGAFPLVETCQNRCRTFLQPI